MGKRIKWQLTGGFTVKLREDVSRKPALPLPGNPFEPMPPKRSNPKTMNRARELRHNLTPAEQRLWAVLRNRQIDGVRFRRHTVLAFGARDMPSVISSLISARRTKNWSSNWTAVSTLSKKNTMPKERLSWNRRATGFALLEYGRDQRLARGHLSNSKCAEREAINPKDTMIGRIRLK